MKKEKKEKTKITKEEVKQVAFLSRLFLPEKELKKYQRELSKILDYIEKLKEVDVSKVNPSPYSIEIKNVFREDEIKAKTFHLEVAENLIELLPKKKEGYLKVKKII